MKVPILFLLLVSTSQILALSPIEKAALSDTTFDAALLWGTYKSMLLHGVTQITPISNPTSFSMMLMGDTTNPQHGQIKYKVKDFQEGHANTFVDFEMHNGYNFAHQKILDPSSHINMTNTFLKTEYSSMERQAWMDLTRVYTKSEQSTEFTNVFFAIMLESYYNNETSYLDFDPKTNQITVNKANHVKEYFRYSLFSNGKVEEANVPYFKIFSHMNRKDNWRAAEKTSDALNVDQSWSFVKLPDNLGDLKSNDTSMIVLQFRIPVSVTSDILFEYSSFGFEPTPPSIDAVLEKIEDSKKKFLNTLQETFTVGNLSDTESNLQRYCISNLLGGLTYEYGYVSLVENRTQQQDLPIFSATPARNKFPHAFLWDEGFHDLLICRWSPKLCMYTIKSWLDTQYDDGWIPREQARGPESLNTIPGDFVQQSIKEGNPPTLLLAVLYLLENANDLEDVTQWTRSIYPKMEKWFSWFYKSQGYKNSYGQSKNLFIWYGKHINGKLHLMGSGLDDYPRNDWGKDSLYNLDLQVWEIVFAQSMKEVANRIAHRKEAVSYATKEIMMKKNLKFFIDPNDHLYKDVFRSYHTGYSECHSNHVGYVSFFPLMFGLVENNSTELEALLDLIDVGGPMHSNWGILSLSRNDNMFRGNDNYWTSPVWVNCNYLILKGLKRYYSSNARAKKVHDNIRENLINNVVRQWESTGYIWENYNADTGQGQGNHPFTGWSTLMALVISNDY